MQDYFLKQFGADELIETLWNVNTKTQHPKRAGSLELIETLWNVNNEETNTEENKEVN